MKMIFFDVETTGLNPELNGIHQLAGEMVINGKVVDHFQFKTNVFKGCILDFKALAVSHTSVLELCSNPEESSVYHDFVRRVKYYQEGEKDKFFLAGWRAPEFDVKFLQAMFHRNDDSVNKGSFNYLFWSNPIDVKVLATQYLLEQRPLFEEFNLLSVAEYLDIEVNETKLHTAYYDAYLTRRIYETITS